MNYQYQPLTKEDIAYISQRGSYRPTSLDKTVFRLSPLNFWLKFVSLINYAELERVRGAMGYVMDTWHSEEIARGEIFVPIPQARQRISITYASSSMSKLDSKSVEHLQYIMLFYNFLCEKYQTSVIITSTSRTPKRQAQIIFDNVAREVAIGGGAATSMYTNRSGQFVERMIQELGPGAKEKVVDELEQGIKTKVYSGYRHVEDPGITADIGVGISNTWATDKNFVGLLTRIKKVGRFLDSRTLPLGTGGEKSAHHLVLFH